MCGSGCTLSVFSFECREKAPSFGRVLRAAGGSIVLRVRPYTPADRTFVLSLAPRLAIGAPPWRDPNLWIAAVRGWLTGSIDRHGAETTVFVAEDDQGERMGVATVSRDTHFTGEHQAYLGELATTEMAEGHGVGTALVQACEQWARAQGYRVLALTTGAANTRALGFYHQLGYRDEDVKLVKLLG